MRAGIGPMRPILQPGQTLLGITGQPDMHALAGDPQFRGDVGDPITKAHRQDSSVPLLDNRHVR
jgi:hypothetical protein